MLGIIVAEKSEINNLLKNIKSRIIEFNHTKYYIGKFNDKDVVVCCCGVGKVNASSATMNMIVNFGVDKIFNIGLAGSCKNNVPPGSIVIADNIVYHDVDLTSFGYKLNQLPDEPTQYSIRDDYVHIIKSFAKEGIIGTVSTADAIISMANIEAYPSLASKEVLAFDMEAAAIAQVCNKAHTDFFCAKLISDNVLFDGSSKEQYDINQKSLSKRIESICLNILEYYSK